MNKSILVGFLLIFSTIISTQNVVSKTWVADLGNGKYKNPILHADYSDPDVCRVGDDYFMTASSFNCIPGLPILHSKDMVNWTLVGHAITHLEPNDEFSSPQHGNGVWAPSIRFYNGNYYIYWGDPDYGIFRVTTKDPFGKWTQPELVKAGKGLIDPCPLWDEDGKVYLVHAFAGSRAGIKSVLSIAEMNADGSKTITPSRIIYDGHDTDPTIEGPKFYKRDGAYYIFSPAGGVATGWQLVLRSESVYGPYERKVVLAQGKSSINGPHQGAWVDTPTGEDWFFHFQDKGAYGRIVHLQPMNWNGKFPVIGEDKDKDGCGEPVLTYRKPKLSSTNNPIATPAESDEFSEGVLGLQWQWHANPQDWWFFADKSKGLLSLFSVPVPEKGKSFWDVPNLLLQKFPAEKFTTTTKFKFIPDARFNGEKAGLVVMGLDYASVSIEKKEDGFYISQQQCVKADRGGSEKVNESVKIDQQEIYFRVTVKANADCTFSYSVDGKNYKTIGKSFTAREGKWIGAKMGLFCMRPIHNNDGGRIDVDWFRVE